MKDFWTEYAVFVISVVCMVILVCWIGIGSAYIQLRSKPVYAESSPKGQLDGNDIYIEWSDTQEVSVIEYSKGYNFDIRIREDSNCEMFVDHMCCCEKPLTPTEDEQGECECVDGKQLELTMHGSAPDYIRLVQ